MANSKKYGFCSISLKVETVSDLKLMKEAFEASYGRKFTMDEFLHQLAASVEDGDPGVWEIYCTMQTQRDELKEKVEASRRLREQKGLSEILG